MTPPKREIIYVDAEGDKENGYKISLYHMNTNEKQNMELRGVNDMAEAEKYAVYYAMFYIEEMGCDNSSLFYPIVKRLADLSGFNLLGFS